MIPNATTTLRVERRPHDAGRDGGAVVNRVVVTTGLPAAIGKPKSAAASPASDEVVTGYDLVTAPFDLRIKDVVTDEASGLAYEVTAAERRMVGRRLEHVAGSLRRFTGHH